LWIAHYNDWTPSGIAVKVVEFEVRRAQPSDAEDIAAVHRDSIRSIGPRFYPPDVVDAWGEGLTADLYIKAMERGEVFYIALGAIVGQPAVLGFASHHVEEGEHRTAVYVRGAAARSGLGSALFRMAEAEAVATGAKTIEVDASLAAVQFYTANGFEETGRGEHQLRTGRLMACVFMRKTLKPTGPAAGTEST
jgi:putative acetyltransferase